MKKSSPIAALLLVFTVGCASNQPSAPTVKAPSSQELDWANKVIALDAQQRAIQKREQELNKQEQEVKQSKSQAWVAQNKEQIQKELTEQYRTNSQSILESFGFNGVVLDYLVDDVALDGNTLSFSQIFLWKNSDNTGEIARINVGYDVQNDKFVGSNIVGTKHFSVGELAAIVNGSSGQNNEQVISSAPPVPAKTPSVWALNNDTVNKWYVAGGTAAAAAIVPKIIDWLANHVGDGN